MRFLGLRRRMWRTIFRQTEGGRGWRQFTTSSLHHQDAMNKDENKMYKQKREKTQETLKVRKGIPVGQYLQLHHICSTNRTFWTQGHDIYDRFQGRGYSQCNINKGYLRAKKAIGDFWTLGHSSRSFSDTGSDKTSIPKMYFVSATAEDYEELMSISSGLFQGTDYLPFRYHEWLKEPRRRMFVAKYEGKVVAFITYILDHDGTTAVMEGLRVPLCIRGHRVAGSIVRFCIQTICSDHPEVKRIVFTRAEDPPATVLAHCKVITSKLGHSSIYCSETMSDKPSIPQIDFVHATAEDYDELMSISSGIYYGVDQLPSKYHEWLKEPQRKMFVAKSEGKVVGFISFILVDDGTTAVMEGQRVASWMRRRGVGGLIVDLCWVDIISKHPEVKTVRYNKTEDPPAVVLTKCKLITSKAAIPVFIPADQMETTLRLLESEVNNLDRSKKLSVLEPEEILRFFEESKAREQLLSGGLLIQSGLSLTTHKSNLDLLLKRQIVWIYSNPDDLSDAASSSKDTTSCDGTHAYLEGFLSLGTPPYPVPFAEGAHRLDIDMFGNDPSCAKVHVLEQLKIGVQASPAGSSIACILYADKSLQSELVQLCEKLTPLHMSREHKITVMSITADYIPSSLS